MEEGKLREGKLETHRTKVFIKNSLINEKHQTAFDSLYVHRVSNPPTGRPQKGPTSAGVLSLTVSSSLFSYPSYLWFKALLGLSWKKKLKFFRVGTTQQNLSSHLTKRHSLHRAGRERQSNMK